MPDTFPHIKTPCAECPWRTDQPTGRFPPARYRLLAATAYDMAGTCFACHKSPEGEEFACAGFLLRGATHNMAVRMALATKRLDLHQVHDGGHRLFPNYRAMAIANGVSSRDQVLRNCRDDV